MTREQALQDLVNEETAKGRDLGAESLAVIEEIEEEERIDRRKALTIKDRLKRRLLTGYVEIPFKDDIGDFSVKMRLPSPGQKRRMLELQMEVDSLIENSPEDLEAELTRIDTEMCELIGHLCLELDAAYIQSGENFGVDVIQKLMQVIVGFEPVKMEEYQFFRSPP